MRVEAFKIKWQWNLRDEVTDPRAYDGCKIALAESQEEQAHCNVDAGLLNWATCEETGTHQHLRFRTARSGSFDGLHTTKTK